ncbi:hypothetical protein AC1031_012485 [Aphanomyces cochlioides]|nr:hypothetical protein AC1031_012485 [Aphanomyces cochlioides]
MAAANGHTNIVKLLLKRGDIDVNWRDCNGLSPLHQATKDGHTEVVHALLSNDKIDVNAKDNRNSSPLHTAVTHGCLDIVKLILGHGAINLSAKQKDGHTALDIALGKGHEKVVRLLIDCPAGGFTGKVNFLTHQSDFKSLIAAPVFKEVECILGTTVDNKSHEYASPKDKFYYSSLSPTASRSLKSAVHEVFNMSSYQEEDKVHFAAFAPPVVTIQAQFTFAIWAFLASQRHDMHEEAITHGTCAHQLSSEMLFSMRRGAIIHIHLQVPDCFIVLGNGPNQTLQWQGEVTRVSYDIQCTSSAPLDPVLFQAKIVVGSSVMVLKSFLFVSQESENGESSMIELKSTVDLIPEQYNEIPYEDLKLKELIGQGHFGDTYCAEYNGNDVVVKTLKAQTFGKSNEEIVREFRHEATVLNMFGHHPNIVPFVGASTDLSHPLALVTEYLPYRSLNQYLSKTEMTIKQKENVLKDAAAGVLNIHEDQFMHRDITARNLLIYHSVRAKIWDFGFCRRVGSFGGCHFEFGVGPLKYMALSH